jgi:hypothetical protein
MILSYRSSPHPAGIKSGVSLESVSTIDLAATMAQLLGLELKSTAAC